MIKLTSYCVLQANEAKDQDSCKASPVRSTHEFVDDEADVYECVAVVPRDVLLHVTNDVSQCVGRTTFLKGENQTCSRSEGV